MTFPIFDLPFEPRTLSLTFRLEREREWESCSLSLFNDPVHATRATLSRNNHDTYAFRFFSLFLSSSYIPVYASVRGDVIQIAYPARDASKSPVRTRATQYSRTRFLQATTSDTIVTVSNIESTNSLLLAFKHVCVKCLRGILAINEWKLYIIRVLTEINVTRVTAKRYFKFHRFFRMTYTYIKLILNWGIKLTNDYFISPAQ